MPLAFMQPALSEVNWNQLHLFASLDWLWWGNPCNLFPRLVRRLHDCFESGDDLLQSGTWRIACGFDACKIRATAEVGSACVGAAQVSLAIEQWNGFRWREWPDLRLFTLLISHFDDALQQHGKRETGSIGEAFLNTSENVVSLTHTNQEGMRPAKPVVGVARIRAKASQRKAIAALPRNYRKVVKLFGWADWIDYGEASVTADI